MAACWIGAHDDDHVQASGDASSRALRGARLEARESGFSRASGHRRRDRVGAPEPEAGLVVDRRRPSLRQGEEPPLGGREAEHRARVGGECLCVRAGRSASGSDAHARDDDGLAPSRDDRGGREGPEGRASDPVRARARGPPHLLRGGSRLPSHPRRAACDRAGAGGNPTRRVSDPRGAAGACGSCGSQGAPEESSIAPVPGASSSTWIVSARASQ